MSSPEGRSEGSEAQSIFEELQELPPTERPARLEEHCADRPELRTAVERLLASTGEDLLAQGLFETETGRALLANLELPSGRRIGPYRVVRELGRGGMGTVYLAQGEEGYRQPVALRLLPYWPRGDSRYRFRRERNSLARIDHRNIARILDGGETEDGQLYLVMELVEGKAITDHAADRRLSLAERLRLFTVVCSAVDGAHRQLVVHRDIHPSNIRVTEEGSIKVLDFGIASLLESDEARSTTDSGPLGSLDYMSPEMYRGQAITVASDVYQLGVSLYELLVGARPYRLGESSSAARERTICVEPPPAPSRRLAERVRHLREDPSASGDLPPYRPGQLAGDLDAIVSKALEKTRERRYRSARELAGDVEAFLEGRPVTARGPSLAYRARRFARRHWFLLSFAAAAVLLLAGWLTSFTQHLEAEKAEAERQSHRTAAALGKALDAQRYASRASNEARAVSGFLIEMLESAGPRTGAGAKMPVEELLLQTSESLDRRFSDKPLTAARIQTTLGRVLREIGRLEAAEAALKQGLGTREALLGAEHSDTVETRLELATVTLFRRDFDGARLEYQLLRETLESQDDPDPEVLAGVYRGLGESHFQRGELDQASELYSKALVTAVAGLGRRHRSVARGRLGLAEVERRRMNFAAAAAHLSAARAILEANGAANGDLASVLHTLGRVQLEAEDFVGCVATMSEELAIYRRILPELHRSVFATANGLGRCLASLGHFRQAEVLLLGTARDLGSGDEHHLQSAAWENLGYLYLYEGRLRQAERFLKRSIERREATEGARSPSLVLPLIGMGRTLTAQGRLPAAKASLERAAGLAAPAEPLAFAPELPLARAQISHLEGRHEQALSWCHRSLEEAGQATSASRPALARALTCAGRAFADLGRRAEARGALEEAQGHWTELGFPHPDALLTLEELSRQLEEDGEAAAARRLREERDQIAAALAPSSPHLPLHPRRAERRGRPGEGLPRDVGGP